MDFNEKLSAALQLLEDRRIPNPWTYSHRWLWRIGVHIPPPHFAGLVQNFLVYLGGFLFIYAVVFLLPWLFGAATVGEMAANKVVLAIPVGLSFAGSVFIRLAAREKKIPLWRYFDPAQPVTPTG